MTSPDSAAQTVTDDLDSFYCHNIVASLWADAVANRIQSLAIYLLSEELPEVVEHARNAARRLADRISDLGGAVTGDPQQLLGRAPGGGEFTIPDCLNPRAMVMAADDGRAARRARLPPRPAEQRPSPGARGGHRQAPANRTTPSRRPAS